MGAKQSQLQSTYAHIILQCQKYYLGISNSKQKGKPIAALSEVSFVFMHV